MNTLPSGTIIHGTLRAENLLPAFAEALLTVDQSDAAHGLAYDAERAVEALDACEDIGDYVDAQSFADDVLLHLEEALCEHVPDGHYFGAHPGDGADFGVWECEEDS